MQAARLLGKAESQVSLIVAHLGAGASVTAVQNGRSIDTTMGLTPLEGCASEYCCPSKSGLTLSAQH